MSGAVISELDRYNSYSPVGSRAEIIFYASQVISNNFAGQIVVPITLPATTALNLQSLEGIAQAYFVLKSLTLSSRKSPSFSDKHRASVFQSTAFASIPTGASNQTLIFDFANGAFPADPIFFARMSFSGVPAANFSLGTITARRHAVGPFADLNYLAPAPIGAAGPPPILLSQYFDPLDGLFNFDTGNLGFDIQFNFNNTTGSAVTGMNAFFFGSLYAYDWLQMLVQYQDWRGRLYNVGVFDDRAASQPYALGQRVPIPLDNPNQKNFGNIILSNNGFNNFFNPTYTYDFELAGTIEYLPPQAA